MRFEQVSLCVLVLLVSACVCENLNVPHRLSRPNSLFKTSRRQYHCTNPLFQPAQCTPDESNDPAICLRIVQQAATDGFNQLFVRNCCTNVGPLETSIILLSKVTIFTDQCVPPGFQMQVPPKQNLILTTNSISLAESTQCDVVTC